MSALLRSAEYYGMVETFDRLHRRSLEGKSFNRLYSLIVSRNNILMAYRMVRTNKGAKTPGTDGQTISDLKSMSESELVRKVRDRMESFKPAPVKRVLIPKKNGKMRPLGIPTILDRIIQQCIKQVLEPIAEAKFFKHSYGFRPLRGTHHALARVHHLINIAQLHYVVDVDIESFFDEVNHTRLRQQIWNLGIKDRRVIAIISKMLKAPIEGEGIPRKGTPQGGILSPLLANIVLNDLDQWVSGQWESFNSRRKYSAPKKMYRALRDTCLKEGYIVRYADDFKIVARDYKTAVRWLHAVKSYLKKRLALEVSEEKTRIINLRRRSSEFLGFEIKAERKRKKYTARTKVSRKSKETIKQKLKILIGRVHKSPNLKTVYKLNEAILGMHNYYKVASNVSADFADIAYSLLRTMKVKFRHIGKYTSTSKWKPREFKGIFRANYRTWIVAKVWIFPIADVRNRPAYNFVPEKSPYTEAGRRLYYRRYNGDVAKELIKIMKSAANYETVEYFNNRLSRYAMRKGKCEVAGEFLTAEEMHCHHVKPKYLGGTDDYQNLKIVHEDIHHLIHAVKADTILNILQRLDLKAGHLRKVNELRAECNLEPIQAQTT